MDGHGCDDELYCTVDETCLDGLCRGGIERDCTELDSQCTIGVCSEEETECIADTAMKDDDPCDDGVYCQVNEVCRSGLCRDSEDRDCSAYANDCNLGLCNEAQRTCYGAPYREGYACEDGFFCTVSERCVDGTCEPGGDKDCSEAVTDPQCQEARCDDAKNTCVADSANEGGSCDDGKFCFENDVCQNGLCAGQPTDCSGIVEFSDCQFDSCDDAEDKCVAISYNNGQACNDGLFCTVETTCDDGMCEGSDRDCSDLIIESQCQSASCDEENDTCEVDSINEGFGCSDDSFCHINEVCTDGSCVSSEEVDCSDIVTDAQCQLAACSENELGCLIQSINEGTVCDDQNPCTLQDACSDGSCTGPEKDCSDSVECTVDVCDVSDGSCGSTPDDSLCDDENECTVDSCDAETGCSNDPFADWTLCQGSPEDIDACFDGVCVPMMLNDWCESSFSLEESVPAKGWIDRYHSYKPVGSEGTCSDIALDGADAFYKAQLKGSTQYSLVLERPQGVDLALVVWTGCGDQAECVTTYEETEGDEIVITFESEEGLEEKLYTIQVVLPGELGDVQDAVFWLTLYEGDPPEDGDIDLEDEGDLEEEIEEDVEEELEADVEAEEEAEVEPICEPYERKCGGLFVILICKADGSGWERDQDCNDPERCEDGECVIPQDGDQDLDVEDDASEEDVAEIEIEAEPEDDTDEPVVDGDEDGDDDEPIVDGDETVEPPPDGGSGSGGGCQSSSAGSWALFVLLLSLVAWRFNRRQSNL